MREGTSGDSLARTRVRPQIHLELHGGSRPWTRRMKPLDQAYDEFHRPCLPDVVAGAVGLTLLAIHAGSDYSLIQVHAGRCGQRQSRVLSFGLNSVGQLGRASAGGEGQGAEGGEAEVRGLEGCDPSLAASGRGPGGLLWRGPQHRPSGPLTGSRCSCRRRWPPPAASHRVGLGPRHAGGAWAGRCPSEPVACAGRGCACWPSCLRRGSWRRLLGGTPGRWVGRGSRGWRRGAGWGTDDVGVEPRG